jgi:RNA polymerase sigma-70 factor (ECF subfamily)
VTHHVRVVRPDPDALDAALEAARRSDTEGFTVLYRVLSGDITAFCRARGANDVDDLVNDIFLGAFRGLPSFTGDGSAFRSFVYRIARNKIFDERRRVLRDVTHLTTECGVAESRPDDSHDTEAIVLHQLETESILVLLGALTDDQREVILLRFLVELSILEVASVTDRPVSAVKALQRRGLATLRRNISSSGGIPAEPSKDTCG